MMLRNFIMLSVLVGFWAGPAWATTEPFGPDPSTLEWLPDPLEARAAEDRHMTVRERAFADELAKREQLLAGLDAQVTAQEVRSENLLSRFKANELAIALREEQLLERRGAIDELLGTLQQVAGIARRELERSLISAQHPGRTTIFDKFGRLADVPDLNDLHEFWYHLHLEATEQSRIIEFSALVETLDGEVTEKTVTRYGPFSAFADNKHLRFSSGQQRLVEIDRQPSEPLDLIAAAQAGPEVTLVALDPSRGPILATLISKPTLTDRVHQGGVAGYIVIAIATFGTLLGVYLIWNLMHRHRSILSTNAEEAPQGPNAVSTIENTYVHESLRLGKGIHDLSVLARMAPLVGLLGSVIGMIATFRALSLYGTGDPQRMADGIAEALVSTTLGIIAAVFLLLLHRLAANMSAPRVTALRHQANDLIAAVSAPTQKSPNSRNPDQTRPIAQRNPR